VPIEAFHVLACGTGLAMRRCAAVPRATLRRLTPTLARVAGAKPVGWRPSNTPRMPLAASRWTWIRCCPATCLAQPARTLCAATEHASVRDADSTSRLRVVRPIQAQRGKIG